MKFFPGNSLRPSSRGHTNCPGCRGQVNDSWNFQKKDGEWFRIFVNYSQIRFFQKFSAGPTRFLWKGDDLDAVGPRDPRIVLRGMQSGHHDCLMISSRNWRKKKRTERPSLTILSFWMFLTRKGLLKHAAVCLHCFVGDRRATATPQNTCRRVLKCPTSGYHGVSWHCQHWVWTPKHFASFAFILHSFAILNEILGQRCWHSWRGRGSVFFFLVKLGGNWKNPCIFILFILEKKNLQTFAKDLEDGS